MARQISNIIVASLKEVEGGFSIMINAASIKRSSLLETASSLKMWPIGANEMVIGSGCSFFMKAGFSGLLLSRKDGRRDMSNCFFLLWRCIAGQSGTGDIVIDVRLLVQVLGESDI
jgi:hypothetical protein